MNQKKYNYKYGMKRPYHTVYALVDPNNRDVPRYIGYTNGEALWRFGRHLGECWGLDSMKVSNLKQRWVRGLCSVGVVPEPIVLYRSKNARRAAEVESFLIKKFWKCLVNGGLTLSESNYKEISNSPIGKTAIRNIKKIFPKFDMRKNYCLEDTYSGILKDTGYA